MRPQLYCCGDARQRLASHEMGKPASEIALRLVFKLPPQKVGNDETEDAIAEEFETFVAAPDGLSAPGAAALRGERAGMRQSLLEKLATDKLVTDGPRQIPGRHVS